MGQLVALMEAWEEFQAAQPKGNLDGFGLWLRNKATEQMPKQFTARDKEFDKYAADAKLSMQAGYLIGKLYQYVLIYTKPIMKKHGLHSMDDFGYLATVQWHGSITKSKACHAMLQEITTGSDIIRRLIRLKYLKEISDKADKRQKLLQLTAKGDRVLALLHEEFKDLPDVLGALDATSRNSLVKWLMNLDEYHDRIVKQFR